jgi:murein DD-endopeptidase MepM/ murein hydrolase activator NlpD
MIAQPLCCQQTTASQPRSYHDIPVHIEGPIEPIPVKGADGKWYLAYHLFLTNLGFSDLTLKSVDVSDASRKNPLTRYADQELADYYRFRTLLPTPPLSAWTNKQYPRQIAVPLTRDTNAGNWIALDLGDDRYAFYAHLQPGSIRVKAGDTVRKGQVIGLLGNSGNAVGPHLHFHVGDEYSLNGGDLNGNEGLPFIFELFDGVGRTHRLEMPMNNTMIRFP